MKTIKYFDSFLNEAKYTNADFSTTARKWFNEFARAQKNLILEKLDDILLSRIEKVVKKFSNPTERQAKDIEVYFRRSSKLQTCQQIIGGAEAIFWDESDQKKNLEEIFIPVKDKGVLIYFIPNHLIAHRRILSRMGSPDELIGSLTIQIMSPELWINNFIDMEIIQRTKEKIKKFDSDFVEDFTGVIFDLIDFYDLTEIVLYCADYKFIKFDRNKQITIKHKPNPNYVPLSLDEMGEYLAPVFSFEIPIFD